MSGETLQLFDTTGTAVIDGMHRYALSRTWDKNKPAVMFIGLNPSRADATYNDATIIRCINFAKSWGYGSLWFGNLYSYRTPYVTAAQLEAAPKSVKDEDWQPLVDNLDIAHNETTTMWLISMIEKSDRVICAWGTWNFAQERIKDVLSLVMKFKAPYCLGTNKDGSPKHPLYLAANTQMKLYV